MQLFLKIKFRAGSDQKMRGPVSGRVIVSSGTRRVELLIQAHIIYICMINSDICMWMYDI